MYCEDELLPISALQHLLFCERQTALIHIERQWEENRLTAEGRVIHRKADSARSETRDGVRIARGLPVHSFELGLYGICDVVTFRPPAYALSQGRSLPKQITAELARRSTVDVNSDRASTEERPAFYHWVITPVEYKRGRPKVNDCVRVQLCAQAMCMEEMLGVRISSADLFYGTRQRRTEVNLDATLRATTRGTARRLHALIESQRTPDAVREKKCDSCSLLRVCMPRTACRTDVSSWLREAIEG